MHYDPIKRNLGSLFNRRPWMRSLFYRLLDILLLRTWHIHRAIRQFAKDRSDSHHTHVLDAGSGFGQYAYYVARKFPEWKVSGIDIKEDEVAACQAFTRKTARKNLGFATADLTSFVQPDCYDLILSVDVMEHIESDRQVFSNLYQSLKAGGMLLISTPSDQGGSGVEKQGDTSFIEEHVRDGYSVDDIKNKLLDAGFSQTDIRYTYGKPGHISWLLSMKYPITLLGYSRLWFIILPLYYLLVMPFVLILNMLDLNQTHVSGTGLMVKAWKANHKTP